VEGRKESDHTRAAVCDVICGSPNGWRAGEPETSTSEEHSHALAHCPLAHILRARCGLSLGAHPPARFPSPFQFLHRRTRDSSAPVRRITAALSLVHWPGHCKRARLFPPCLLCTGPGIASARRLFPPRDASVPHRVPRRKIKKASISFLRVPAAGAGAASHCLFFSPFFLTA
jgi:hypothetical protein